uniref:Uncharacterized protein n=1 Tax=Caenorhabditis japonica TaxID=281687 RepID=A0A8R1EHC9_CAEJA
MATDPLQNALQAPRIFNWHHSNGLGAESSLPLNTTATTPQLSTTASGAGSSLAVSKTAWTPQLRTTEQHNHYQSKTETQMGSPMDSHGNHTDWRRCRHQLCLLILIGCYKLPTTAVIISNRTL